MDAKPCSEIKLPPGFRFHPSDEELIHHYLKNKVTSTPLPASIIADIDLYKYDPWELPNKALFGEDEWYFFTPRDRKYPNGARPNRAAASGYWKATGTDKPILNMGGTTTIGVKKALVFYKGRLPKGIKTDWFMHEYRLMDTTMWSPKRKGSMRLDDWVLCRVRQKSTMPKSTWEDRSGPVQTGGFNYYQKPKTPEPLQANTDPNVEMVKTYLYNDFPMLPYIFGSSQEAPFTANAETAVSHISFQSPSTEQSSTTTFTDISSFDDIFKLPKRKHEEIGKSNICVHPSKKLLGGSDEDMGSTDLSEESSFSPEQWHVPLLQYPELNQLEFAGSY